jgi:preprotein translocase subunit SecA
MTGTAETEAAEFDKIYKLEITVIPTNKPMLRADASDIVYRTIKEKYKAVADDIATVHETGQPMLVGTTSIEKVELLVADFAAQGREACGAECQVPRARGGDCGAGGRLGMVTIATNMAGRGTDIVLGGNPDFMTRQELVKKGWRGPSAWLRARSIRWLRRAFCASITRARSLRLRSGSGRK